MKRTFSWTIIVALAIVVALPLGCGCRQKVTDKIAEKAIEKAIESDAKKDGKDVDVKMDMKGGSMSIKSKDGSGNVDMKADGQSFTIKTQDGTVVSGDAAKLPDTFPKDVPVYPGAKLALVSTATQNEMFNVNMTSTDTIENVASYYKKELAAKGWTETQSMTQGGDQPMQMLNYTKEDRMAMVMASRDGDKTTITLATGKN